MAIVRVFVNFDEPLTQEELDELAALKNRPIVYDEDCPRLTKEQLKQFKPVNPNRPRPKRPATM